MRIALRPAVGILLLSLAFFSTAHAASRDNLLILAGNLSDMGLQEDAVRSCLLLVMAMEKMDFQKNPLPPLNLSNGEEDKLIDGFVRLYNEKLAQDVSRRQATLAAGIVIGYYSALSKTGEIKRIQQDSAPKTVSNIPQFDFSTYCKIKYGSSSSSYMVTVCLQAEAGAKSSIEKMSGVPDSVMRLCTQEAMTPLGGSYRTLKSCIDKKMVAQQKQQKK